MQENVFAHLVTPLLLSHTLSIFTIIYMTDYSTTASKPNVSVFSLPADMDSINCYPLMRLKMLLEDIEILTCY